MKRTQEAHESIAGQRSEPSYASLRDGFLIDFISGKYVKDTPEERDAVQVFAQLLVED